MEVPYSNMYSNIILLEGDKAKVLCYIRICIRIWQTIFDYTVSKKLFGQDNMSYSNMYSNMASHIRIYWSENSNFISRTLIFEYTTNLDFSK